MSTYYGPKVGSTANCILALDAYDQQSYSGSGNTWYDLSPQQNHCSPSDPSYMPTFVESGNYKYFEFDGPPSHQNFTSQNNSPIEGTGMACTVIAGFEMYDQITSRFAPIISCGTYGGGSNNRFSCLIYGYQATSGDLDMGTDIWSPAGRRTSTGQGITHFEKYVGAWVIPAWGTTKTTTRLFVDGYERTSESYSSAEPTVGPTSFPFVIGNWQVSRDDMDWNGKIFFVYVYDYAMTNAEVLAHTKLHAHKVGKTI